MVLRRSAGSLAGLALALGLSLAACGGSDDAPAAGGGSAAPSAAPADSTPGDLASRLNCDGFKKDEEATMFAAEEGTCELDGVTVYISTFTQDDAQKNWLQIAKAGGGVYVVGQRWIVWTDTRPPAEKIQKIIGGGIE